MSIADEIAKLDGLRQSGALSEEEFQKAKADLLAREAPAGDQFKQSIDRVVGDENTWGLLIHLSQFCGYMMPMAGWVVPIVLWVVKKNDSPLLDRHGRIVINWIISEFIYAVVCVLLVFALIGIPLFVALIVCGIVFPIVGAVKASQGEAWPYPLSIRFLAV